MKLQLAIFIFILVFFSSLPACKKKNNPKAQPEPLGYAGKMVGKHLWRTTRSEILHDSNGYIVFDSNGNAVIVSRQVVVSDSIIVFSNTKMAFTSSRYSRSGKVYDTLNRTDYNEVQKTLTFANSDGGFASGHYWTTKQMLLYDYVADTFVRRISYYGQSTMYDSTHVYYYSP